MACLNCLACLGYDSDGNLGAQLADGGGLTCTADGELALDTTLPPISDDLPIPIDRVEDCENGVMLAGTRLWSEPTPTVECFSGEALGFEGAGTIIGENTTYLTPPELISLPAADPCCETLYNIAIRRWIQFDQNNGSLYTIQDIFNGTLDAFNTVEGYQLPADRHFSQHANGYMAMFTRPAGAPAINLQVQMQVNTFTDPGGAANQGIVYNYGWRWDGIAICKGC